MQLQYDVRAEIVDYVPRILRLPCKQEDDDDYKGNGGGVTVLQSSPPTALRALQLWTG